MITNQVDMMTELARKALPTQRVIGIGNQIDSMRYKFVLSNLLFQAGCETINPNNIEAHIIGFHNNDMLLLKDSLRIDGKIPDWDNSKIITAVDKALEDTKSFGKTVSDLQSHPNRQGIDSGSSIAPAEAITRVIKAICTGNPLVAAFNIRISDEKIAMQYGVKVNTPLSIPIIIQGMDIMPITFNVLATEKEKLQLAQQKLIQGTDELFRLQLDQPLLPDVSQQRVTFTVNSLHTTDHFVPMYSLKPY
jgi:malate/lactate dehydrogenase